MVRLHGLPRLVLLALFCVKSAPAFSQETEAAMAPAGVHLRPLVLRTMKDEPQLPIDYGSALRLATAQNLDIMQARARLREATGEHLRGACQ